MVYDSSKVGERIKSLRKSHKLTQAELAEKLRISTGYLQDIEGGRRNGSLDILIDTASFFNVGIEYILFGPDSKKEMQKEQLISIARELFEMAQKM